MPVWMIPLAAVTLIGGRTSGGRASVLGKYDEAANQGSLGYAEAGTGPLGTGTVAISLPALSTTLIAAPR